jgi:hypothetical protein
MSDLLTTEQLEKAAKDNLEIYLRSFNQITEERTVSKRSMARVIAIGLTEGLTDSSKKPNGFVENTLVELVKKMQDCTFALKAIQLEKEAKKMQEQEEMLAKAAVLPKGDLND